MRRFPITPRTSHTATKSATRQPYGQWACCSSIWQSLWVPTLWGDSLQGSEITVLRPHPAILTAGQTTIRKLKFAVDASWLFIFELTKCSKWTNKYLLLFSNLDQINSWLTSLINIIKPRSLKNHFIAGFLLRKSLIWAAGDLILVWVIYDQPCF